MKDHYLQPVARLSKKSPVQNNLLVEFGLNPCTAPLMGRVACYRNSWSSSSAVCDLVGVSCGGELFATYVSPKKPEKLPSCISYLEPSQLSCFLSDGKIAELREDRKLNIHQNNQS